MGKRRSLPTRSLATGYARRMDRPPPRNDPNEDLDGCVRDAFREDAAREPTTTLRGGNALDDHEPPPGFDRTLDDVTDAYLEQYAHYGLVFLDALSWRHYLPSLIDYALRRYRSGDGRADLAIGGLLGSLRPRHGEPARFASLSTDQRALVKEFLERLSFDEGSGWQDEALEVLAEYWG
jgi:hypothetical protein